MPRKKGIFPLLYPCTSVAIRALASRQTLFCGGGAAPANICVISIRLCDASSLNVSINSQIYGYVCLNIVEKRVCHLSNCYLSAEVCLRPDYACSTTRERKLEADVGSFSTLQYN